MAGLPPREELLAAAWLMSLRSARTRRAYAGDLRAWLAWLGNRGIDVLAAGRVHADLWVAGQLEQGAEAASVRRRLSALSSFYRYCAAHGLVSRIPTPGVAGPVVDPDYTATVGLAGDEARAVVAAADADRGGQALRTAEVIRLLLLHNALRVDDACAADVLDLGADAGHRVLRVTRKGARKAKIPLTLATAAALDAYLADRARCWPPPSAGGCSRATCGSWCAASPAPPASRHSRNCRHIRCGTRRSHSRSTPAPPSATYRTTPGTRTREQPAGTTTPGQPGPQRRLHRRRPPGLVGTADRLRGHAAGAGGSHPSAPGIPRRPSKPPGSRIGRPRGTVISTV
jgi:integrase